MGGMKFETTTPQKFLFGAISDLNYLGPYTLGADLNLPKVDAKNSNGKPSLVKPIEILINLRKSSLRKVFNVNSYDYRTQLLRVVQNQPILFLKSMSERGGSDKERL